MSGMAMASVGETARWTRAARYLKSAPFCELEEAPCFVLGEADHDEETRRSTTCS